MNSNNKRLTCCPQGDYSLLEGKVNNEIYNVHKRSSVKASLWYRSQKKPQNTSFQDCIDWIRAFVLFLQRSEGSQWRLCTFRTGSTTGLSSGPFDISLLGVISLWSWTLSPVESAEMTWPFMWLLNELCQIIWHGYIMVDWFFLVSTGLLFSQNKVG